MYMLLTRVKIQCIFGHLRGVLWTFTCDLSSIVTGKCTVHTALSLRKMPWFRTAEALSGKIYAPIFWFQECDPAGAGLVITKMFWEKLVAVKWSLVGSMYMLLTGRKYSVFGHLKGVLWTFTCDLSSIVTENTMCIQHSHCVKCLDFARRKHYQAKSMHPFLGSRVWWGWARLGWWLLKCFGKGWWQWNGVLVGSMYMLLTRSKI